jgi:hypothetical protein
MCSKPGGKRSDRWGVRIKLNLRRKSLIEWKYSYVRLLTNYQVLLCAGVARMLVRYVEMCKLNCLHSSGRHRDVRLPSLCHSVRYPWYIQNVPRNLRYTCSCFYASRRE